MIHESELFKDIISSDYAISEKLLYYGLLATRRNKKKTSCVASMRTVSGELKRFRIHYTIEELTKTSPAKSKKDGQQNIS